MNLLIRFLFVSLAPLNIFLPVLKVGMKIGNTIEVMIKESVVRQTI